jgi:hypothetical protein
MEAECHNILHAGEGELGESVTVMGVHTPYIAACEAADYFDQGEMRDHDLTASDIDGITRFIQVDWHDGPHRFAVRCHIERRYDATRIDQPTAQGE